MKMLVRMVLGVIIISMILSCNSIQLIPMEELKERYKMDTTPSQENYPNADAVILLENNDIKLVLSDGEILSYDTRYVVKKLFKNIEDYADVTIYLYPGDELIGIDAQTIKADGSIVKVTDKDIYTKKTKYHGINVISKSFTFPGIEENCIIEYTVQIMTSQTFIYKTWYIQHDIPTLINRFEISIPTILFQFHWDFRYKIYNDIYLGDPVVTKDGLNNTKFTWEQRYIAPFESEPSMPSDMNYRAYARFAPPAWKDWNAIAKWEFNQYKDKIEVTDKIQAKADELTKNATTDMEKIDTIFTFVQKLDHKKLTNDEFGKCNERYTLLIALLKAKNIKAHKVIVKSIEDGSLDFGFPNISYAEYVIKAITPAGRSVWLDPYNRYLRPNQLVWYEEGVNCVEIDDEGKPKFDKTIETTYKENITDIKLNVHVQSLDSVKFNVDIEFKGHDNIRKKLYFEEKTNKEIKEYCKSLVSENYLNTKIIDCYLVNNDSLANTNLKLHFSFTTSNAIQKIGDLYMINYDPFKLVKNFDWLKSKNRKYPILFDYASTKKKQIKITFNKDFFKVNSIPKNRAVWEKHLNYKLKFDEQTDTKVTATELLEIRNRIIPPEFYLRVVNFYNKVQNKTNESIIFEKIN